MRYLAIFLLALIAAPVEAQSYRIRGTLDFDFTVEEIPMFPEPIAAWKCEDATSSVGDYDLTLVGTPTFAAGKMGNAMYLSRTSNQYGKVPNAAASDLKAASTAYTDGITIAGWVYPTSTPGVGVQHAIIASGETDGWKVHLGTGFGNNLLVGSRFGVLTRSSTTALTANAWNFVAVTNSATALRIYVNSATADATFGNLAWAASTEDFNIGSAGNTSSRAFDGRLDGMAVFDQALTAAEIAFLYNSGVGRQFPLVYQQSRYLPMILPRHRVELAYAVNIVQIHREFCGTMSIRPKFQGQIDITPTMGGTMRKFPKFKGDMESRACRS